MSLDTIYSLWQKAAYLAVHLTTIWLLLVLFTTAFACWVLAGAFDKQNVRAREAKLARLSAVAYTTLAMMLWLFSFLFK